MPVTIIATADVHLGMKFATHGSYQGELSEERFRALERVVQAADRRAAQVLVVAGDLFHRVRVAERVVERAAGILSAFSGAVCAVLPGNHDYLASEGDRLWHAFQGAAGDRVLVLREPRAYDLAPFDVPVTILAGPCDAERRTTSAIGWIDSFDRDAAGAGIGEGVLIGVAHGSIPGLTIDSEGHYFPMDPRELASSPADLWIIGHTHRYHHLKDCRLVVPGTPEPDGFDTPQPGGAVAIVAPAPGGGEIQVKPFETGRFRFAQVDLELRAGEDLAEQVQAVLPDSETMVKLTVTGRVSDQERLQWNRVRREIESEYPILRLDDAEIETSLTAEDLDRRYAQGTFAHRLLEGLVADQDHDAVTEVLELFERANG